MTRSLLARSKVLLTWSAPAMPAGAAFLVYAGGDSPACWPIAADATLTSGGFGFARWASPGVPWGFSTGWGFFQWGQTAWSTAGKKYSMEFPAVRDGTWQYSVAVRDAVGNIDLVDAAAATIVLAGVPLPPGIPVASAVMVDDEPTTTVNVKWALSPDDVAVS